MFQKATWLFYQQLGFGRDSENMGCFAETHNIHIGRTIENTFKGPERVPEVTFTHSLRIRTMGSAFIRGVICENGSKLYH